MDSEDELDEEGMLSPRWRARVERGQREHGVNGLVFEAAGVARPTIDMRMALFMSGVPDATSVSFHDELGEIVDYNVKWGAPSDSDEVLTYAGACCFLKHLRASESAEKLRLARAAAATPKGKTAVPKTPSRAFESPSPHGVEPERGGVSEHARKGALMASLCRSTRAAGQVMSETFGPLGYHRCDGKRGAWRARAAPEGWGRCPMCTVEFCAGCSAKCPGCQRAVCRQCSRVSRTIQEHEGDSGGSRRCTLCLSSR